jgi:hypothetical protein
MIPHPGLGIDGFADCAEQAQRAQAVPVHVVVTPAHESADGRGRGVKDRDPVAVDDVPEAVGLRVVRRALIHEHGGAAGERAIDDVAVPGDPADVGGAPVNVGILEIEDVFRGHRHAEQITRGRVEHALGFAGGTAGIEDEERRLGFVRAGLVQVRGAGHEVVPPEVAARGHGDLVAAAAEDDDVLDAGRVRQGAIDAALELDDPAAAPAAVGGDDQPRLAVVDAVLDGLGAETAKDDGVHDAQSRARQHRHGRLGHHRHVNGGAIALLQAERFEHVGKLADLAMQLPVCKRADVTGLAFENNGGLVLAMRAEVAVEAVFGKV